MNRREFLKAAMLVGPVVVATPWVVDYLRSRSHTGLPASPFGSAWWPYFPTTKYDWTEHSMTFHITREQKLDELSGITKAMRGIV